MMTSPTWLLGGVFTAVILAAVILWAAALALYEHGVRRYQARRKHVLHTTAADEIIVSGSNQRASGRQAAYDALRRPCEKCSTDHTGKCGSPQEPERAERYRYDPYSPAVLPRTEAPLAELPPPAPDVPDVRCCKCRSLRVAYRNYQDDPFCAACADGSGPDPGGHTYDRDIPDWVWLELNRHRPEELVESIVMRAVSHA